MVALKSKSTSSLTTVLPLRAWMGSDEQDVTSKASELGANTNQNNRKKISKESIIRRATIAYGIVELLRRTPNLTDEDMRVDNFVISVSNKVRSSRSWDDIKGVGMISSGMSLNIEEPSYLSTLLDEEGVENCIVGRCLEVELTSVSQENTYTQSGTVDDSLASVNEHTKAGEDNKRCHFLALLLHELFTNESFSDNALKTASTEVPPKKRARFDDVTPSKKLLLSRADEDFQMKKNSYDMLYSACMQKLGVPTSINLMVQNLLRGSDSGQSVDTSYDSMEDMCKDLHLLLLDPDRFLFDNKQDVSDTKFLYRKNKLYGRDKEENLITDAFCRVSRGKSEAFFIGGFSGSGKSMLVNTLTDRVNCVGGYTIKHKFDPNSQEKPLSGVISAFNQVCTMISDNSRPVVAKKLREEFGFDFGLLMKLLPNVTTLFQDIVDLAIAISSEAVETMNTRSVCFTLLRFARVVSSPRHPIMLFLDDIQWADSTALDVIHTILSDMMGSCVFFVGAYRDNEVHIDHPIFDLMERLEISNVHTTKLALHGLNQDDLNTMISDALCLYPRICKSLSDIVYQKTKGSPFFVLEFMQSLKSRGLLQYNTHQKRWVWNEDIIRAENITDNVLHLLASKMVGLSDDLQLLLKVMACVGSSVNKSVISCLSESNEYVGIQNELETALRDGYIEMDGEDHCKFAHDKVREAAYNLIPGDEKEEFHYNLGKVLLSTYDDHSDVGDTIFVIANQINHGKETILKDDTLRIEVAKLNMKAGEKAVDGCDHKTAHSYLSIALSFLPDGHWESHYELSLQLSYLVANAARSCCQYDEANVILQRILSNSRCLDDQLPSYFLLTQILQAEGKVKDVYDTCSALLTELGESIPPVFSLSRSSDMAKETLNMYERIGYTWLKGEEKIVDSTFQTTLQFYNVIALASFFCKSFAMVVYFTCKAVQLTLSKGLCEHSVLSLLQFTSVVSNDGNAAACYRISKDALALLDRFDVRSQIPKLYFNYYGRIAWRFEPFQTSIGKLKDAFEAGLSSGQADMALHCLIHAVKNAIFIGANLKTTLNEIDYYLNLLKTYKSEVANNFMLNYRETVSMLIDNGKETSIDAKPHIGDIDDPRNKPREAFFHHAAIRCYWIGHTERCRYYSGKCLELFGQGGQPISYIAKFYVGLNAVDLLRKSKQITKSKEFLKEAISAMKDASVNSEWNFSNKLKLLEAEHQSISKHHWRSIPLYDESIELAKKSGFIHEQGLACEKAGLYYKTRGDDSEFQQNALKYLEQARECYEEWGSSMKVDFVQKELDALNSKEC